MKRLLPLLLFFVTTNVLAQNWLKGIGGAGNDESFDITLTPNGNQVISGLFSYGVDFDVSVLSSVGETDAFVAYTDGLGNVIWVKQFGGTGADAAYANAVDGGGNVYVAGYYSGTMTVDGTTLSSTSASQDVFLAKLDPSGNLLWIRDFGGTDHDFLNDLAIDDNNNVVITGMFKQTVTIGSQTYNSVWDPEENESSYDIFIAKYDPNGTVLWSKHGQAKHEDRGMGLDINSDHEIVVIGQFSDTLIFDNVYNNQVYNSGFVMLLDSDGDELWMQKMSASVCIPYDVKFHEDSLIYVTGDFTGQLTVFTNPFTTTTSNFQNKIFVTKLDHLGNVIWLENDGSDSRLSSRGIAIDDDGNSYLSGYFQCRLDEYSQQYGEGVFYSAGRRDVFITRYSPDGVRDWEKHFGGHGDDVAWGVAISSENEPIITGAFSKLFNAPDGGDFLNTGWTPDPVPTPPNPPFLSFCNDSGYGDFATIESTGHQDILLAHPVDLNREPYDYFKRPFGGTCQRDQLMACINNCSDTIEACEPVQLWASTYTGSSGYIGPRYNYLWSTGAVSNDIIAAQTNEYWLEVSRDDNCYVMTDTVTVIIHPFPSIPLVSDDVVVNTNAILPEPVFLCYPDTVLLQMSGVDTVNNYYGWQSLNSQLDTSVTVSGLYTAHHVSPFGCEAENEIQVWIDDWANQDTLDPHLLWGTGSNSLGNSDTIYVCEDRTIYFLAIDSNYYQSVGLSMPYCSSDWNISFPGIPSNLNLFDWEQNGPGDLDDWMAGSSFIATESTWVIIDVEITDHCNGDTSTYMLHDEFYLDVSGFSVSEYGPGQMCPGDTVEIGVIGGDSVTWQGSNYTGPNNTHTLQVIGADLFYWVATFLTSSGGQCTETGSIEVENLEAPDLTMVPAHGTICPYDSVLITAPPGSDYIWIGPNNATVGSTQSIYATTPGFYFCQFINSDGCFLISNEVEVRGFNSPYIFAEPQQTICEGGTVTLSVVANEGSFLDWPDPLVDGVSEQDITMAGYYEVVVEFCDAYDTVGITVIDVSPEVELSIDGSITICDGEILEIDGPQGFYNYDWSTGSSDPAIEITTSGEYYLSAENFSGCIGYSDTLTVEVLAAPNPPILSDTIVCYNGSAVSYEVNGSAEVYWFNAQMDSLGILTSLVTNPVTSSTGYFGALFNGECYSLMDTASIELYEDALPPVISGTVTLCNSDTLHLTTLPSSVLDHTWVLPDGSTENGENLHLANPDTGVYVLQAEHPTCGTQSDSAFVSIIESDAYNLSILHGGLENCLGDTVVLGMEGSFSQVQWMPMNTYADTLVVLNPQQVWSSVVDTNGCNLLSDTVSIQFQAPPVALSSSSDTICIGDSALYSISATEQLLLWESGAFDSVYNPFVTSQLYADTAFIFQLSDNLGCVSDTFSWQVTTIPIPASPTILGDSSLCPLDTLQLSTSVSPDLTYFWTLPDGSLLPTTNLSITNPDAGIYTLTSLHFVCYEQSDSISVELITPMEIGISFMTGETLNCEGDTVILTVSEDQEGVTWLPSMSQADSILILESQTVAALVVDTNGCSVLTDSVELQFQSLPVSLPSEFDTICSGSFTTYNPNTQLTLELWDGLGFSPAGVPLSSSVLTQDSMFTMILTDNLGCSSSPFSWSVEVIELPDSLSLLGTLELCEGDTLILEVDPANQGTVTIFDFDGNALGTVDATGVLKISNMQEGQLADGVYAILEVEGCELLSEAFEPEVLPIPEVPTISSSTYACPGDSLTIQPDLTTNLNFHWIGPGGFYSDQTSISFMPLDSVNQGVYSLVAQQSICYSDTNNIEVYLAPQPNIALLSDTVICVSDEIEIFLGQQYDEMVWSTGELTQTILVSDSGSYWVDVTNEFGCQDSDTTLVETTICVVSVSNVLTPNGDGVNDTFTLISEGMSEVRVKIFSRFGRLIHRWDTLDGEWNGTIQNNGLNAPEGTYYFVGEYKDVSGGVKIEKGYIYLIR